MPSLLGGFLTGAAEEGTQQINTSNANVAKADLLRQQAALSRESTFDQIQEQNQADIRKNVSEYEIKQKMNNLANGTTPGYLDGSVSDADHLANLYKYLPPDAAAAHYKADQDAKTNMALAAPVTPSAPAAPNTGDPSTPPSIGAADPSSGASGSMPLPDDDQAAQGASTAVPISASDLPPPTPSSNASSIPPSIAVPASSPNPSPAASPSVPTAPVAASGLISPSLPAPSVAPAASTLNPAAQAIQAKIDANNATMQALTKLPGGAAQLRNLSDLNADLIKQRDEADPMNSAAAKIEMAKQSAEQTFQQGQADRKDSLDTLKAADDKTSPVQLNQAALKSQQMYNLGKGIDIQGPLAGQEAKLGDFLQSQGVSVKNNPGATIDLQKAITRSSQEFERSVDSRPTESMMLSGMKSGPSLETSKEGRQILLFNSAYQNADQAQSRAFQDAWLKNHNSLQGSQEAYGEFRAANPPYKSLTPTSDPVWASNQINEKALTADPTPYTAYQKGDESITSSGGAVPTGQAVPMANIAKIRAASNNPQALQQASGVYGAATVNKILGNQ